jgi:hypothetical protein
MSADRHDSDPIQRADPLRLSEEDNPVDVYALSPYFGGRRLSDISSDHVFAYIAKRQTDTGMVRSAYDVLRKAQRSPLAT